MKKTILIFLTLLFVNSIYYSQTVFNNTYDYHSLNSRANAVVQSPDNGFLIAGINANGTVMRVVKTNSSGDTLWNFIYDLGVGSPGDYIYSAINTRDGNYLVGGTTGVISALNSDAFLIKIKNFGDTIWVKKYGMIPRSERCHSIKQTSDGGFIFCGWRYNSTGASSDIYLVKTDSLGNQQWEQTYGGSAYDFGNSVAITSEGGFLIYGYTYSFGVGQTSEYLIKTDSLGNMLWQHTYGGSLQDYGTTVLVANDGNYLLAGATYTSTDTTASHLIKTDTSGNIIWEKKYRGGIYYEEFNAMKQLSNGDIVVSGDEQGDSTNYKYYGIAKKLDSSGNVIWQKQYKFFGADSTQHYFYAMDTCTDGGFVMAGMTIDFRQGASPTNQMWLIKTDCMGNDSLWDSVNCSVNIGIAETQKESAEITISPNPSTALFTITTEGQKINQIKITNIVGATLVVAQNQPTTTATIDLTAYPNGIYFLEITTDKGTLNKKIIKQ